MFFSGVPRETRAKEDVGLVLKQEIWELYWGI
jgi:hypothetical protein